MVRETASRAPAPTPVAAKRDRRRPPHAASSPSSRRPTAAADLATGARRDDAEAVPVGAVPATRLRRCTDLVLAERRGPVLVLTLNRPERLNAWTDALEERYYAWLDAAEDDPEVRAIVVTGAGPGILRRRRHGRSAARRGEVRRGRGAARPPAAADVPADRPQAADRGDQRRGRRPRARRGALLRRPLRHAGGEAHHRVRAAAAWSPSTASPWLLPRLVGYSAALDLLLSGRVVRGEEALRLRLVDRLASRSRVVDDAVAYAAGPRGTYSSPWSMATIKAQVQADLDRSFADGRRGAPTS